MYGHGAPKHPEYPTVSIICAFLVLVPIATHLRARNVATLSMMAWLFVMNIIRFVNTLVWANNADIRLIVWCDITTKIQVGSTIAFPAATLCICRYLQQVAAVRVKQTPRDERRRMIFEGLMCFGLPMFVMALHYISQGHRFDIVQEHGCTAAVVKTWVALLTLWIPPLLLGLIGFIYAGLAVYHFYHRRLDLQIHLKSSKSRVTASVYLRLMLLAITEMSCSSAIHAYIIWCNATQWGGFVPYESWESIHWGFSRIQPIPIILAPAMWWRITQAIWWAIPLASFFFFAFFAFGQESIHDYRKAWNWIQRKVFRMNVAPLTDDDWDAKIIAARAAQRSTNFPTSGTGSRGSHETQIKLPSLDMGALEKGVRDTDRDSFVSADGSLNKHGGLTPITPVTCVASPTSPTLKKGESYLDQDLDTSVFDRISISDSVIEQPPRAMTRSDSLRSTRQSYLPYHPNNSTTFADTAVRPNTPNSHTNGVRVHVSTEVANDVA